MSYISGNHIIIYNTKTKTMRFIIKDQNEKNIEQINFSKAGLSLNICLGFKSTNKYPL